METDRPRYLAMNSAGIADHEIAGSRYVQALRKSGKRLWLSFDEWKVWYRARRATPKGTRAFGELLRNVYNLEDACSSRLVNRCSAIATCSRRVPRTTVK